MRFRLVFFLCFLLAFFSLSFAQSCLNELQTGLSDTELTEAVSGLEAAAYLRQTVELLEPALPQRNNLPSWFALSSDIPEYPLLRWLAERDLLIPEWQASELTEQAWLDMVNKFRAWYDLDNLETATLTHEGITSSLASLIAEVAPTLRPVALVASSKANSETVSFVAVIRNDSVYPRLIVFKPQEDLPSLSQGAKSILPALETCAMNLNYFLFAQEEVAKGLFLENNNGQMYVVAASPTSLTQLEPVAKGFETAYLTYQHEAVQDFDSYSVVFAGSRVPVTTVLRLLPRVRTNMNPNQVLKFALGK